MSDVSASSPVPETEQIWGVDQENGQVAVYLPRPTDKVCPSVILSPAMATSLGNALIRAALDAAVNLPSKEQIAAGTPYIEVMGS